MEENIFLTVNEVSALLGVSVSYAYKVIAQLNKELKAKGFFVINGKVNKQYFSEKIYGGI